MTGYRGLFYFIMASLFFYSLFFSKIIFLDQEDHKTSLVDRLLKLQEKDSQKPDMMLVETFVEMEKPKNPENISNLDSKRQGRITKAKGYSYFSDIRFMNVSDSSVEFKTTEKDSLGALLEEHQIQKIKHKKDSKQKIIDLKPNQYTRQQIVINMDSDGFIGISAQNKEYAEYLTQLAKKVFYNWVDFVPFQQIRQNLIKTDKDGYIWGTIGLYFDKKTQKFSTALISPFASETINDLTARSFIYLKLPAIPNGIEMNFLLARFNVYPSLRVEAEFKFDFIDKKEKK